MGLFWKNNNEEELKKLEKKLQFFLKPSFGLDAKHNKLLKKELFHKIELAQKGECHKIEVVSLVDSIKAQVTGVQIPAVKNAQLKERVMKVVENSDVLEMAFGSLHRPSYFRSALASLMLMVVLFSTVVVLPFQAPVTFAAKLTYIEEVYGDVYILRDGQNFIAKPQFALVEGDTIMTKDKSFTTIRFFDDSTSRLGQNTFMELRRLHSEQGDNVSSQVEVAVNQGRVWTKVLNLVDEQSHFTVDTAQASITATKKAAFDVQVQPSHSTLAVFDNVVDVSAKASLSPQVKPVVAGFKADVSPETMTTTFISPISSIAASTDSSSNLWVQSNLERDKEHIEKIATEKEDSLNAKTGLADVLHVDFNLDDSKAFKNPDLENARQDFIQSYKALLEGEKLLLQHKDIDGMKLIFQFKNGVNDFIKNYPDLVKKDSVNAVALRDLIKTKISGQHKDLVTFVSGDLLYPAKEVIEETVLLLSPTGVDQTLVSLSLAEEKLLEIQNLLEKNNAEMAMRVLQRYKRQIDEFTLKIDSENYSEVKDKLVLILSKQVEQVKVLAAIEKSLTDPAEKSLLADVKSIRLMVINKLISALQKLPQSVPAKLIKELRDLVETYLKQTLHDDDSISKLNKVLESAEKEEKTSASQESKTLLPVNLGVVTLIDKDKSETVQTANAQNTSSSQNSPATTQATSNETNTAIKKEPAAPGTNSLDQSNLETQSNTPQIDLSQIDPITGSLGVDAIPVTSQIQQ